MSTDEFALRDVARSLAWLYRLLDQRKTETPPPREARVMHATPGRRDPLPAWILNAEDCLLEERKDDTIPGGLRVIVMDAAHTIGKPVSKENDRATAAELCDYVGYNANLIAADFPAAGDLAELMEQQAHWLAHRLNPRTPCEVANSDPYLTADSLQRSIEKRGSECPAGTIRRWAHEGGVATKKRRDGRTAYRLKDVLAQFDKRKENHADHRNHHEESQEFSA